MGAIFALGSKWTTGHVTSVSITNPGSGYISSSNLPTINIEHRKRVEQNGIILSNEITNLYVDITVGGQGDITGITITNGGLFYEVGDIVTIVSDNDEPAELTITAVEP